MIFSALVPLPEANIAIFLIINILSNVMQKILSKSLNSMPKLRKKVILLQKIRAKYLFFYNIYVRIKKRLLLNLKRKNMSQVASKVVEIIVEKLSVNAEEVVPAANFQNDLGADSLDTVELIMEFEKAFDISIPDEDAEKIATVGDAISYIESKQ